MKKIRCYLYTRVSTTMQVDGYSLDAQREKLRKYAEFQDMLVVGEYSDEGFSGKNIQGRREFQRMLNDIQEGKDGVSFVLVFKLSRFGRNAADILKSLQLLEDFGIEENDVRMTWKALSASYKLAFNNMIYKIVLLAQDQSEKDFVKYMKAMSDLGRLGKSEVVTPPEIVEKMINKLDDSEYKNAKSILLVNEKQAEFFYGLYKKFGKEVAKKCKIIPSSQIGKHLTTKLLKTLDMNDYINAVWIEPYFQEPGFQKLSF